MSASPHSPGRLPLPGAPGSSWALYRSRFNVIFQGADTSVLIAFWLFGLINNVLYVIILSAALDLVGPTIPKGVVLLTDVIPSFATKLIVPYFLHKIPYSIRILVLSALSSIGMLLIALTPSTESVGVKLFGVILASISSGGGEVSFLGLTHYYGPLSLAAWGSGTGGAGLVGAGLYVLLTTTIGFSVKNSLLASAFLPAIMLISFFVILPRGPLRLASRSNKDYHDIPSIDIDSEDIDELPTASASEALLAPGPAVAATAYTSPSRPHSPTQPRRKETARSGQSNFQNNLKRAKALFIPYMLPLLLVYIAEYTINQGVSPTLLFPLQDTPFTEYRSFYPFYNFLYQIGVFIARSSTPFIRIHNLYLPSFLQLLNLLLLISHAVWDWIPSVWFIFVVVFWEGLLGGAVYVNTFAEIMEKVPEGEREFSLGATSVSDSGGICIAGFIGMALEVTLCEWQVSHGRPYCKLS